MARDDVARTWQGLETWARSNLPGILTELNGPAEPRVIARLEAALGFALPADFRTSVGVHDGEAGDGALLDSGAALLSIQEIEDFIERERKALRRYADLGAESLRGPAQSPFYLWHRVPIIDFNQDVTWLLDLDPALGGEVGQVLRRDVEAGDLEVVAPSFSQFLADYLHRLETGGARFSADDLDRLRQVPPDRSGLNARLQRFSQALRDQSGLDLGRQPDGSDVHVVGSLALPTPGMAPDEYPFMMGTGRVILRGNLGFSPQDIMVGNVRGDLHLYRVRGVVRRRLSRHGREEITLELKSFETFN
jgi:cell wall assembly regulator SMI1